MFFIPILYSEIWEGRTWFGELVLPSPLGGFEHNFLVILVFLSLAIKKFEEALNMTQIIHKTHWDVLILTIPSP